VRSSCSSARTSSICLGSTSELAIVGAQLREVLVYEPRRRTAIVL
jgi:hypothetical protein